MRVGAAILLPNRLEILGDGFAGARARTRNWNLGGSWHNDWRGGPLLGGWLIDVVSWRAIFLVNLPLAIAAIALACAFVENRPRGAERAQLDVLGGVLATFGLGALTWGLTIGAGRGGWRPDAGIGLVAGIIFMLSFVWFEGRSGGRAMLPLALFGSRMFVGLTLLTFFLYGALCGLLVLLPYLLIVSAHYSSRAAGVAVLPFPLIIAFASFDRWIGWPCLMLRIGGGSSYWSSILPAIVVVSLDMAGAVAPLTTAVLAHVDAAHTGSASGFNSAVSRAGGLITTALRGGVLGATGPGLIIGSPVAAFAGAAMAMAASASALLLVRKR